MKFLVFFTVLLAYASADLSPPSCINNYTTFMDKVMNETNVSVIETFNNTDSDKCSHLCNINSNCTSFNYYPKFLNKWISKCSLISSEYNSSYLIKSFDNGFYLKSNNDCSSEKHLMWILYGSLSLIGLLLLCCGGWHCCRKKRGYTNIN